MSQMEHLKVFTTTVTQVASMVEACQHALHQARERFDARRTLADTINSIQSDVVKLDIGGQPFHTSRAVLTGPTSKEGMLGAMFSGQFPEEMDEEGYVFLDRDPRMFGIVLDGLRNGKIELVWQSEARRRLYRELGYYGYHPICVPIRVPILYHRPQLILFPRHIYPAPSALRSGSGLHFHLLVALTLQTTPLCLIHIHCTPSASRSGLGLHFYLLVAPKLQTTPFCLPLGSASCKGTSS
jgi:hypothetical protein